MNSITITVGEEQFEAALDEELAPNTVALITQALPMEGRAQTWGDEIYFNIPVVAELENGVDSVSVGDLAYWPQGNAFCIFYGKTPMSQEHHEIIPASAVTPLGRIQNPKRLKNHAAGETVTISRAE